MTNFTLVRLVQVTAVVTLTLLSQQCQAEQDSGSVASLNAVIKRKLGLEDYMRSTPRPTPPNEETTTPTIAPTQSPTAKPTGSPTQAPTTEEPTLSPTEATKKKDSELELQADTETPTSAPTTAATEEELPDEKEEGEEEEPTTPQEQPQEDSEWDLFSETLQYQNSIGDVFVDFSLYSPNITHLQMNFMKLKMGACGSIDALVCDITHPIKEQGGPEYCAVRDDVLLRNGEQARQSSSGALDLTDHDVTVMALATTNVKESTGVIHLDGTTPMSIAWTTWRMSWNVLQLGPALRDYIAEQYGSDLTETDILTKGLGMLQQMMTMQMERTLREGVFQHDLSVFMEDIMVFASVVGEEVTTFGTVMGSSTTSSSSGGHMGQELETGEDGEGGGLMVVFFFAGLGVACCVIVTLLYFSFRSRQSVVRRKRTIVILDDNTSKEGTDSSQESSSDRVIVTDAHSVMQEDPPRAQQDVDDAVNQQWEATSSVEGGDVESQWGRSASAYTGSISAITGVSGLEQSDTWSVGSMSIDLAEWG